MGGIIGDIAGQALCDAPPAYAPTGRYDPYRYGAFPNYDQERRQLAVLGKHSMVITVRDSSGHTRKVRVSAGRGGSGYDPAAAARAAALAAERARAERVRRDALTPHARPASSPTIAADIQAMIDAGNNAPAIDLGILDPTLANGGDQPFVPGSAEPAASLPSASVAAFGDADSYVVLFGQKRADPNFSRKPGVPDYLKGRSIKDVALDLA